MINVFYFDLDLKNSINGVSSYKNNIIPYLEANRNIILHYVVFSDKFTEPKVEEQSSRKLYKLPVSSFSKLFTDDIDLKSISFFVNEIKNCKNIVLQFNWINLCNLAYLIKKQITCTTILVNHCISWKEYVSSDYKLFYELHNAFTKNKAIKITNKQILYEIGSYTYIDHIITVTDCAKKSFTQLFKIDTHKLTKISNGLNPSLIQPQFNHNKNKLRKQYGFDEVEKLMIFAGNINLQKGIFDIVSSLSLLLKKHPNFRLIIAGPGNYEGILKLAKNNWSRITLCGSLDKQTLYDFYAMSDMGIVPSYVEQCSYTCMEMMHNSLPIIVSDVDGLKEMVNDDCGLRIKVDFKKDKASLNQKDLIEKISFLLENPEKAKRLTKNAMRYALANFTAERMAEETVAVYEKTLSGKTELIKNNIQSKVISSSTPFVSIIIPCYNAQKYLQECLESIFKQSFTDFEVILINDGSSDGTDQLIKNQTDTRIVYLQNESNLGISYSLNKAIKLAKGKYIARMDADDTMHVERLKKQIDFLEANLDYGLVGSLHNVVDPNGMPFYKIEVPEENKEIDLGMLFFNPISHPTVIMRSELAKKNPYNIEYSRCEDYELWFRLSRKTKIKNIQIPLINYRTHPNNTVMHHQKEMQQNVMELLSDQLDKRGIEHTTEELVLHCAIGFGMGKRFFNTSERLENLNNWLNKVFASENISSKHTKTELEKFRRFLLEKCVE
ncbi:glycosyltransferase [Pedobacter sp. LMG 31464]|uniref:Glycosyltransferase n=1 Tax=Pedobacter planticolens TaxID=2679964 RepID=A0A923DXX6_9SPHI|nr:glycosyltransferase [Pedobacter planticolens]MBB2143947.1 glycosyltransferase [Pedobacter planticolens]